MTTTFDPKYGEYYRVSFDGFVTEHTDYRMVVADLDGHYVTISRGGGRASIDPVSFEKLVIPIEVGDLVKSGVSYPHGTVATYTPTAYPAKQLAAVFSEDNLWHTSKGERFAPPGTLSREIPNIPGGTGVLASNTWTVVILPTTTPKEPTDG